MAYTTNLLKDVITILNQSGSTDGTFGRKGTAWTETKTISAGVDWTRGTKALREGALDAYDVIMIRCRYTDSFTRNSRVKYNGKIYSIESFHADKQKNTIQATASELVNA